MAVSSIEWTQKTWNPVTGCTAVGCECDHCYARTMAERLRRMGVEKYRNGFAVRLHGESLAEPLAWRRPSRVFVCSMSDLFHGQVPDSWLDGVFAVMALAGQHTFQVLTKRPARARAYLRHLQRPEAREALQVAAVTIAGDPGAAEPVAAAEWPLPNVWVGTSVGIADALPRVGILRDTPAAVRFLSLEPLLGPLPGLDLSGIDWVIAGGESGPGARPMDPAWARGLRDSCVARGVPFFFKQWGGPNKKRAGRVLDGRTWDEMPRRPS